MAHRGSQPTRERYVSAFVDPSLRRALEASARANDRSLSAELRCALRAYIADSGRPGGAAAAGPATYAERS